MTDVISAGGGQFVGTAVVMLLLVGWLVRRNLRPRQLRVERLWIRPALFAAIVVATLSASSLPMDLFSVLVFAVALFVGVALGWQRGKFMQIEVDPETHAVSVRASPLGVLIILGILGLKVALRSVAPESQQLLGLSATTVTDALSVLLGSTVVTQSLEMWLRARRLLEAARVATAARGGSNLERPIVS